MITVEETEDYQLVREILTDDDIWWRISDISREFFEVPEAPVYLLARVHDEPAALFILHHTDEGCESHFQMLPAFRDGKYQVVEPLLSKAKEYADVLRAEIPKRFPNVHHFALKAGYVVTHEDEENWYYQKEL